MVQNLWTDHNLFPRSVIVLAQVLDFVHIILTPVLKILLLIYMFWHMSCYISGSTGKDILFTVGFYWWPQIQPLPWRWLAASTASIFLGPHTLGCYRNRLNGTSDLNVFGKYGFKTSLTMDYHSWRDNFYLMCDKRLVFQLGQIFPSLIWPCLKDKDGQESSKFLRRNDRCNRTVINKDMFGFLSHKNKCTAVKFRNFLCFLLICLSV